MSDNMAVSQRSKQSLSRAAIIVIFICWFMTIFEGYDVVVYGTVVPSLLHYKPWALNAAQAGIISGILVVGMIFGAFFVGPLADNFGRRNIVILDLLIFSFSLFLCGIAPTPLAFIVFRFIGGIGIGGIIPTSTAIVIEYAPPRWRSMAYTIVFSGYGVGGILVSTLAIPLIPAFGWQVMFYVNAIACLLTLPLTYWLLPESIGFLLAKNRRAEAQSVARRFHVDLDSEGVRFAEKEIIEARSIQGKNAFFSLFGRYYVLPTILFALISFFTLYMIFGVSTWLSQLMTLSGYSPALALLFVVVLNVGSIFGNIFAGAAADRFGSKSVGVLIFLLGSASFFLLSFKVPVALALVLGILVGNGSFGAQNILNAYVAKSYPVSSRASAMSVVLGIGRFGGLLGPSVLGLFQFWHISLQWSFYALAIPGVICAITLLLIPKTPTLHEKFRNTIPLPDPNVMVLNKKG
jgi:AAHS family benzoate transporter-like MFS transporter